MLTGLGLCYMLSVGREVKMEIPVYSAGNNGVYCVASYSWHRR